MEIFSSNLNYVAILVATVMSFLIGWLWYSPLLFGKPWMEAMGLTQEKIKQQQAEGGMGKMMAIGFCLAFLTAFYLAHFAVPGMEVGTTIKWALFSWLGLVVTTNASDYLWGKRSMKLFMINMAHHAVVITAVSVLLTLWK